MYSNFFSSNKDWYLQDQKLSKYESLQMAQTYINALMELLVWNILTDMETYLSSQVSAHSVFSKGITIRGFDM